MLSANFNKFETDIIVLTLVNGKPLYKKMQVLVT